MNSIVDHRDPDYCETCGGECVAGCKIQRIHAFDFRGHALCGSSNKDDGDEPASHDPNEVTCLACKELL